MSNLTYNDMAIKREEYKNKKVQKFFSIVNPRGGISLIVLAITMVVMLILVGVTIFSIDVSNDEIKKVTFLNDVLTIEDAVTSEYFLTGKIYSQDNVEYSKNELLNLIKDKRNLAEEIILNGDENSTFTKLSLANLNLRKSNNGFGKDKLDYYVVAKQTLNVYYLKGVEIDDKVLYSTITISPETILNNTTDDSSISTSFSSGINVTRNSKNANKLGIKLEVNILPNEQLYISFCEGLATSNIKRLITTTVGNNVILFNNLTELQGKYASSMSSYDIAKIEGDLSTRLTDRYIYIGKFKNGELLGNVKIDLNDYLMLSSSVETKDIVKYTSINTVTLNLKQGDSNIKEIRYVYDKVYNTKGDEISYYNVDSIDDLFVLKRGKKANVDKLTSSFKVDKYVKSIKVLVIDVSGNYNSFDVEVLNSFDGVGMDLGGSGSGSGSGSEQPIKDVIAEGDYIKYNSKRDYKGTWRVLYDGKDGANGNRIEIISTGNADYLSIGNAYSMSNAASSYANIILDLNASANLYLNEEYADRARCVGSNTINPSFEEEVSTDDMEYFEEKFENLLEPYGFIQTHYEEDVQKLKAIGEFYKDDSYWLAARGAMTSFLTTTYSARLVDSEDIQSVVIVEYKNPNETIHGGFGHNYKLCGVRPVISIKKDAIITGGDGTENNPYILD